MAGDSLLADIKAAVTTRAKCGVGDFVATLDTGDRTDLDVALKDPTIPSTAVYRALVDRGLTLQYEAFRKHAGGRCSCGRTR